MKRISLGLAAAALALWSPAASAQVNCDVEYRINSQWPTGMNVTLTLENPTARDVEGWELAWTMTGDERITQLWNGDHVQDGTAVRVRNLSYNARIPAGGEVVLGFNASVTVDAEVPDRFSLNGLDCAGQAQDDGGPPDRFSRFVAPASGDVVPRSFPVQMVVGGLTVEPAGPVNPDAGHLHILVDTDFIEPGQAVPFDAMHLHYGKGQLQAQLDLEPGPHTLRLQFADGQHIALPGTEYMDRIDIIVAESMILEPTDGATVPRNFTVRMQAAGLRVEPAGEVNPASGHLHLLVDTDFIKPGDPIPFDSMHLHYGQGQMEAQLELEPGTHTIRLQFADGKHVAFDGPQYRNEITVTVADAADADGAPGPDDQPDAGEMDGPSGAAQYASLCAGCHGDDGLGLGAFPSLLRAFPSRTAFVQKVLSDMPVGNPASCGSDCSEAVTLYVEQVLRPAQGLVASVTGTTSEDTDLDPGSGPDPNPDADGDAGSGSNPDSGGEPTDPSPPLICEGETPAPRALRLLTRREYDNTVQDLLGLRSPLIDDLPVEARIEGYDNNAAVNVVTARHVDAYLAAAADLATRALQQNRAALLPCNPEANADACAEQFVRTVGLRAYRRPLTQEERNRLVALVRSAGSFDDGVRQGLTAMLMSPHFLYRSELGVRRGNGFELTPYEVASALSYLFLGSMPDDALFEAAAGDRLRTAEDRALQAQRLLQTPRARNQIGVFAGQWLGADPFQTGEKDAAVYPNHTPAVQAASDAELVAFVSHVIFDSTGQYHELFDADYVFANQVLAQFYGLPGVSGFQMQRVPVGDGTRGGVLGLASVLAAHAHSDDSSPIKRGVFVRERLLCHDLPDPPPAIDNTPPGLDPSLTTRERFAAHSASSFCQTCHQYIDGIGFGLEGYNGAGEFRRQEFGIPIDDSGTIKALQGFDPGNLNGSFSSVDYNGLRELSTLLGTSADGPNCLATQYFRYARGYVERDSDACTVSGLQQRFAADSYNLQTLLVGIVKSPSFALRRDQEGQ